MTVEFFGVRGFGSIGAGNKIGQQNTTQKSSKTEDTSDASFSSALQGANGAQATGASGNTNRAAKVQELKEQVANGSYEPDLNQVASSLLKFLVEEG